MPITINGSGTITGLSAGGLPDGSITAADLANPLTSATITTATVTTLSDGTNSTSATNAIQGSAKAWVNFAGSTGTVRAAYNVSSVTRNSTGTYTINFSSAFADINYSAIASIAPFQSSLDWNHGICSGTYTTSSVKVNSFICSTGVVGDKEVVNVAIYR